MWLVFLVSGAALMAATMLVWMTFMPLTQPTNDGLRWVYNVDSRGGHPGAVCFLLFLSAVVLSYWYVMFIIAFTSNGAFVVAAYIGGLAFYSAAGCHAILHGWEPPRDDDCKAPLAAPDPRSRLRL